MTPDEHADFCERVEAIRPAFRAEMETIMKAQKLQKLALPKIKRNIDALRRLLDRVEAGALALTAKAVAELVRTLAEEKSWLVFHKLQRKFLAGTECNAVEEVAEVIGPH